MNDTSQQRVTLCGTVVTNGQRRENQVLVIEDGRFLSIETRTGELTPDVRQIEGVIVPGFLDIHVHGCYGYDVMDGTVEAFAAIAEGLVRHGVTGFLATTLTADLDDLVALLQTMRQYVGAPSKAGAELLGIHLEGPWVNARYKGAQNAAHIIAPTLDDAKRLWEAGGSLIKLVTLAPEQPKAEDVIAFFVERGVRVSVGHSDATYDKVQGAIQVGLSHVTHCFNAMRPLHHREPGVVGAALYHDELTTELIADGVHVHPIVMSLLQRVKTPQRLVLVSDGMRAVGLAEGEYRLGDLQVQIEGAEARLADGTLAGSTLTLDRAVRNMMLWCGASLPQAVQMASETPAQVAQVEKRKGQVAVGYDADFAVLNEEGHVQMTFVGGRLLYQAT